MLKNKLLPLAGLLLGLAQPHLLANDIEPSKEFYTVVRAPKPIVIDGDLSEWTGVPVLADPKFYIVKGKAGTAAGKGSGGVGADLVLFEEYNGGTWTGPDDQTSAVQIAYDADNVYFGFVVTDDYHENAANSAWNGDSIQLMIASSDRTAQVALYNYALGGVEGNLGDVIILHEAGPGGTTAAITRNAVTHKTTYEIKLPKESLGLDNLFNGPQFGLGMAINDGDQLTPGQKGWGGLGAHAIVFGKTPSETALITLAKPNDIEPGKEYYTAVTAPKPIVLDGVLGEWAGVPVLADPKFYIRTGKQGTAAGKGSGGVGADLVLFEEYNGGTWTGPDDQTSAVQIAYDADNVFFGFVVTDDYHENAANSAWNGDSVQLMIASADRTTQVALYNYALGGIEGATTDTIILHEAGPGGTEAIVTRDAVKKKTYYEIKLPASSLGLTAPLTVGTKFGLGMAINDGDQLTPGQKGWGGLGAHAIVFGKTPSETAEVTLGTAAAGTDLVFLSAINPSIVTFSFRANDKGLSIVNNAKTKLTIDAQVVTLVGSPKVGDATDFTYTRATPFVAGKHTYAISVGDSLGNVVTDTGEFVSVVVPTLTKAQQASSVDKTKPGFIWRVFQNEAVTPATIAEAELALTGKLDDGSGTFLTNLADPAAVGIASGPGTQDGPLVKFEIPGVVNVSQVGAEVNGFFTPDDQMPGIPGLNGVDDGIDAEIVTFVELPAGVVTLGSTADDRISTSAGYINTPADRLLLAESAGVNTIYKFFVQDAGIYPVRTVYQEGIGAAHIELYSVKANGEKALLNDPANGGLKTYRVGVVPTKSVTPPTPPALSVARNANGTLTVTFEGTLEISDKVEGPYTPLTGTPSPLITPVDQLRRFARARR